MTKKKQQMTNIQHSPKLCQLSGTIKPLQCFMFGFVFLVLVVDRYTATTQEQR